MGLNQRKKVSRGVSEFVRSRYVYLDHVGTETVLFTNGIHILFQIHIKELEYEVELCFGMHNIQQPIFLSVFLSSCSCSCLENVLYNVVVLAQLFQQTDFSDRCAWHTFIFRFKANLLEGDNVARVDVFGLVHHTIGPCFLFCFGYQGFIGEAMLGQSVRYGNTPSPTFSIF